MSRHDTAAMYRYDSPGRKGYAPMFGVNLHGTGNVTAFEALQRATTAQPGSHGAIARAVKYNSNVEYRTHLTKHLRRADAPSDEYDAPITESQKIGWEVERYQQEMWKTGKAPSPTSPRPLATAGSRRMPNQQYHHKATEISHYNDCVTKHDYGRSVKSEFGAYGRERLATQALEDHKNSGTSTGLQQPEFGRYTPMHVPMPRTQVLGKTNMPMSGTFGRHGDGSGRLNTGRYGEHFLKTCG
mmetsp:Transcript_29292/g.72463  ORF Transcript_29292/g.72463 Transcript_29292/m.72463 type:complete len:242 (-) Transcript_29292:28-753(-)